MQMDLFLSLIRPVFGRVVRPAAVPAVAVMALAILATQPADAQSRRGMGQVAIGSRVAVTGAGDLSEQDHAYSATRSGRVLPLGQLLQTAAPIGRGKYIGVEPDISNSVYRFKFVRPTGNVVWVDVDGRTGHVLAARH